MPADLKIPAREYFNIPVIYTGTPHQATVASIIISDNSGVSATHGDSVSQPMNVGRTE